VLGDSHRYALAVDEARRALDAQAADVARIRDRSAGLVGLGALAAAFIGGLSSTKSGPPTWAAWTGAAAFLLLLLLNGIALWPRRFTFAQRAAVLVSWAEDDHDQPTMERDLALHMCRQYDANTAQLDQLTWLYMGGLTIVLVEIALLLVDLRGR
jgi:hypothetical protein